MVSSDVFVPSKWTENWSIWNIKPCEECTECRRAVWANVRAIRVWTADDATSAGLRTTAIVRSLRFVGRSVPPRSELVWKRTRWSNTPFPPKVSERDAHRSRDFFAKGISSTDISPLNLQSLRRFRRHGNGGRNHSCPLLHLQETRDSNPVEIRSCGRERNGRLFHAGNEQQRRGESEIQLRVRCLRIQCSVRLNQRTRSWGDRHTTRIRQAYHHQCGQLRAVHRHLSSDPTDRHAIR